MDAGGTQLQAGDIKQSVGELIDQEPSAAAGMEREIGDQLAQSGWPTEARPVIRDGLVLGVGVAKGQRSTSRPKKSGSSILMGRRASRWSGRDPCQPGWTRGCSSRITAKSMRDNDSVFEGHPMSAVQFAALADQPGFDKGRHPRRAAAGAARRAGLECGGRQRTSGTAGVRNQQHMVWEYSGPVAWRICRPVAATLGMTRFWSSMQWCSSRSAAACSNGAAEGGTETNYHCWSWRPDANSIFGYGIPYELGDLRTPAARRGARRDNASLAVGGSWWWIRRRCRP